MSSIIDIRTKFKALNHTMNERMRGLWAATEARAIGWGGVSLVSTATGMSRTTITEGIRELSLSKIDLARSERVRRDGAGRSSIEDLYPKIKKQLEILVESTTRGDPQAALRWTCKSTQNLSDELQKMGMAVSDRTISHLLHTMKYSLQANRKNKEGSSSPDRNEQFELINRLVKQFQKNGQPVISVDTKKKELIGDFRNGGSEWRSQGNPEKVRVHDFIDKKLGKGIPYGVYDMTANQGWVSVGNDHDTAEFAVASIARWWKKMGSRAYPRAKELLITADSGGSNASRSRLWRREISRFSKESGLKITVCHFPPGTSKWNKIEHRMFCHITQNWRGRPLVSTEVMVNLIGSTKTKAGLKIKAGLDRNAYEKGIKVTEEEFSAIKIQPHKFRGDWNYTINS